MTDRIAVTLSPEAEKQLLLRMRLLQLRSDLLVKFNKGERIDFQMVLRLVLNEQSNFLDDGIFSPKIVNASYNIAKEIIEYLQNNSDVQLFIADQDGLFHEVGSELDFEEEPYYLDGDVDGNQTEDEWGYPAEI